MQEQEDELSQLQEKNQLLRENADLYKEQITLLQQINVTYQEKLDVQAQLIDKLQRQITLLEQQVLILQVQLQGNSDYPDPLAPSVRFSRHTKGYRRKGAK